MTLTESAFVVLFVIEVVYLDIVGLSVREESQFLLCVVFTLFPVLVVFSSLLVS